MHTIPPEVFEKQKKRFSQRLLKSKNFLEAFNNKILREHITEDMYEKYVENTISFYSEISAVMDEHMWAVLSWLEDWNNKEMDDKDLMDKIYHLFFVNDTNEDGKTDKRKYHHTHNPSVIAELIADRELLLINDEQFLKALKNFMSFVQFMNDKLVGADYQWRSL
jgi:hypothetical protein